MAGVLLIAITAFWGYNQYRERQQLELFLSNRYQQDFYEMVEDVEQLQVLLGKSLVSVSPQHNIVGLTNIWSKAMNAQQQLTNLPLSEAVVYRTAKFLAQTGDFAHVMAQKNAEGQVLTEEERQQLANLRQQAAQLSSVLNELENEILEGNINWGEIIRGTRRAVQEQGPSAFRDGFDNIQQELNKHPTLIYNGPFSDHIARIEPKAITGDEVTAAEAEDIARQALDVDNQDGIEVVDSRKTEGMVEAYNFIMRAGDSEFSIDISQNGGNVINILNYRRVDNGQVDLQEATDKAQKYLASIGYANMEPTYAEKEDGTAFVAFVYQPEDIIYYSDLIKVQIALDNKQVMSLEAINYLTYHHQRDLAEPEITEDEIENMVAGTLDEIEEIRLVVIPDKSMDEIFCYEVRGMSGEEEYLIYINAVTAAEEEILQIITTETGRFTI